MSAIRQTALLAAGMALMIFSPAPCHAAETGNVLISSGIVVDDSCGSNICSAKVSLGTFTTSNGHSMVYLTEDLYLIQNLRNPNLVTSLNNPVEMIAFDLTAGTYVITTPGGSTGIPNLLNFSDSGTFTGTIAADGSGGHTISVELTSSTNSQYDFVMGGGTSFVGG